MESSRLDLAAYHDSGRETQGDSQFKTWQNFKILNSQLLFTFPSMLALPCSSSLMRGMDCDQIVFPWEWREPLIHSGSEPHWISLKCHAAQTISWLSCFHCSVSNCPFWYMHDFVFSYMNLCQAAVLPTRKGDKPTKPLQKGSVSLWLRDCVGRNGLNWVKLTGLSTRKGWKGSSHMRLNSDFNANPQNCTTT